MLMLLGALMTLQMMARDFEYTYEGQTLTYTVISEDDKTCMTKEGDLYGSGNQVEGVLVIPAVAFDGENEYSVTAIGKSAFIRCSLLSSITIPNSVIEIGENAFFGCFGLCVITIPDSVTVIGQYAFGCCFGLTSITIPNSITTIKKETFQDCRDLVSITIPDSVVEIGELAFYRCTSLTSVYIPESIATIVWGAFRRCNNITSVYYGAKEPIESTYGGIFETDVYENATLYVPAMAVDKCKLIDPWKNFNSIEVYDLSGTEEIGAGDLPCEVYTVAGVKVGDSTDGLAPGIYIVRQGNDVKKIVVN